MKRTIAVLALSALFAAPAFAQRALEQPNTPDDGVGVDYTQPYVNDLLLRMQPLVSGNMILQGDRLVSCEKERMALSENPLDPALDQAYELCREKRTKQLRNQAEKFRDMPPPPGPQAPLFKPDPNGPRILRPLPPTPNHPNVQN